jgi:hypothetical protein
MPTLSGNERSSKASFVFSGSHPAGTVNFNYSFLGNYAPNCWAQYLIGGDSTTLDAADPLTPATTSFPVAAYEPFGFILAGPPTHNNGCQVSPNQTVKFKISGFNLTP